MKYIQIRANKPLGLIPTNAKIKVMADDNGVPFDNFWRKRLSDAKVDHCCEVVEKTPKSKPKELKSKRAKGQTTNRRQS